MKIQKQSVFSSLRSLLLDEQLLWQLKRIHSMVTLDMQVVSAVAGVHGPTQGRLEFRLHQRYRMTIDAHSLRFI